MQTKPDSFFSFRHTNFCQFLISVLLPILVLSFTQSAYYLNQALTANREAASGMMDTAIVAISENFDELEHTSFTPYLYSDVAQVMTYMRNGYLRPGEKPPAYLKTAALESNYTMLFTKMLHTSQQRVRSISFYPFAGGYGDAYTISRNTAGLQYSTVDPELVHSMYEQTAPYGTASLFLHMEDSAPGTYSLLRIIRDIDTQKDLGVFRIDTETNALVSCVGNVTVTENSSLLLLDPANYAVYSAGEASANLVSQALAGQTEGKDGHLKYQLQVRDLKGWHLVLICSVADIQSSFRGSLVITFLIALVSLFGAIILYRAQTLSSITSIESILEAIRQFQKGNLSYVCQVRDRQKYGVIADALSETGQTLQNLIQAQAEAKAGQSRAEFQALQSQINPHFLYNTLNGFIALNRMGERKQLETSILQLTRLFRHICSSSETVRVDQEFQFAAQYLELQKLRFGERIDYRIELDPVAAEQIIPKLIIQPLVENCIVHGLEEGDEPIEILLRGEIIDASHVLLLEIQDTGVGFDPKILNTSPRVGLNNVLARLELFRQGAKYEIHSAPGQGTHVQLRIPLAEDISQEDKT